MAKKNLEDEGMHSNPQSPQQNFTSLTISVDRATLESLTSLSLKTNIPIKNLAELALDWGLFSGDMNRELFGLLPKTLSCSGTCKGENITGKILNETCTQGLCDGKVPEIEMLAKKRARDDANIICRDQDPDCFCVGGEYTVTSICFPYQDNEGNSKCFVRVKATYKGGQCKPVQ